MWRSNNYTVTIINDDIFLRVILKQILHIKSKYCWYEELKYNNFDDPQ